LKMARHLPIHVTVWPPRIVYRKRADTVGQPPSKFEEYFFLGEFPQLFCLQRRHLGHTNLAT
jgi:hypothetical protein